MDLDNIALHMARLGLIRAGGAAARAVSGGAAPRLRQVGLALLRADLRRARRALEAVRIRGSGWYDWRDVPPHIVVLAVERAQHLGLERTRAAVFLGSPSDGPSWLDVGRFPS
ncbi:MAG: hypothetical protein VYB29_06435 [Candidatus Thermoplasmatota archaeon]|nr:hypothetical protein [Candidatus Thermoplasmatota archaeon]